MLKKISIGVGIVVVIIIMAMVYMNNRNRTLSPAENITLMHKGLEVSVDYSRPSVRGRKIFGSAEEGALLPNGKYWRLGANEPTQLKVNRNFEFNGIKMMAGQYDMYAIPQEESFELRLNSGGRFWGYTEPDYNLDVLKTSVTYDHPGAAMEQFTIKGTDEKDGILLLFMWADRKWEVLITAL